MPKAPNKIKVAKPHQKEAIAATIQELKKENKALVVSACGTGKTYIGAQAAKHLIKSKTGICCIFVPSRTLLWQTAKTWIAELPEWKQTYVCSEGEGTTDPELLADQILHAGRQIIFCTYHSAKRLQDAFTILGKIPDLAIMDEAHATAMEEGRHFAFTVKTFQAKKKIFMTATPKHYLLGDIDHEATEIFSMEDPKTYGNKVFHLPLREAIQKGIVADYRLVISADKKDVHRGIFTKIATLEKAFNRYNLKKMLTFHQSVADADCFAKNWEKFQKNIPAFHINGSMKMEERNEIIAAYLKAPRAILTSAKALAQGVDLPETDSVAILCRKESIIEITQIIGRALRLHPGKEKGTIILPLTLLPHETITHALKSRKLEYMWEILQSLLEQENPERILDDPWENTQAISNKIEVVDENDTIDASQIEDARAHIHLRWVNSLRTQWDINFEKLIKHKEKTGFADIEDIFTLAGDPAKTPIKVWIEEQRTHLPNPARKKRLNDIGFQWENFDGQFPFLAQTVLQNLARGTIRIPTPSNLGVAIIGNNPLSEEFITLCKFLYQLKKSPLTEHQILLEKINKTFPIKYQTLESREEEPTPEDVQELCKAIAFSTEEEIEKDIFLCQHLHPHRGLLNEKGINQFWKFPTIQEAQSFRRKQNLNQLEKLLKALPKEDYRNIPKAMLASDTRARLEDPILRLFMEGYHPNGSPLLEISKEGSDTIRTHFPELYEKIHQSWIAKPQKTTPKTEQDTDERIEKIRSLLEEEKAAEVENTKDREDTSHLYA